MRRYPKWLTKEFSPDGTAAQVTQLTQDLGLATVCESALCPNIRECYSQRQLTFMILGDQCTRRCRFCAVDFGKPAAAEVLADEPERVAEAVRRLQLEHAVITMVARDDLADEGAGHVARTILEVRWVNPSTTVEVLVSDFHAREDLIRTVMAAVPEIFAHNVETVERLTPLVRAQATYQRSLQTLRTAAALAERTLVKSSLMLGLGETVEEVECTLADLVQAGCTHLTLGQYIRPTAADLPVVEYVSPERFAQYEASAYRLGFRWVKAGPMVRSSYHAIDALKPSSKPEFVEAVA